MDLQNKEGRTVQPIIALLNASVAVGHDKEWISIRREHRDSAVRVLRDLDNDFRYVYQAYADLLTENLEQARLLGMSAERELALLAKRDSLKKALQGMIAIHDEPSGFASKYGRALDEALAIQKAKIDTRIAVAREALQEEQS